ncbi:hypothetical protein ACU8KH_05577 [Lachancea thermotolerans]
MTNTDALQTEFKVPIMGEVVERDEPNSGETRGFYSLSQVFIQTRQYQAFRLII